jgi:hypothetical protein
MIFYIFVYALIAILLIGAIWGIYKYFQKKYSKKPIMLLDTSQVIEKDFKKAYSPSQYVLPDPIKGDILGITYGFKLFIENASENENWGKRFDQLKPIIKYSPGVYYHPYENYLEFSVVIQKSKYSTRSVQTLKVKDVPIQQWLKIIVVYSSNRIKVYFNGNLVASRKLENPPILEPKFLYIGEENNNIKGILGPIIYWAYPLEEDLIHKATQELN